MRIVLGVIFIAFIASCAKPSQHNDILKIELARCGAWGDHGAAISIDTSLVYKYYGDINHAGMKYYTGKVSPEFWDTLNRRFERTHYKTFHKSDEAITPDVNYFELIIRWKGGKNRIIKMSDLSKPEGNLLNSILWLNDSYRMVDLKKTQIPVKFETVFQNPPPKPRKDSSLRFPASL